MTRVKSITESRNLISSCKSSSYLHLLTSVWQRLQCWSNCPRRLRGWRGLLICSRGIWWAGEIGREKCSFTRSSLEDERPLKAPSTRLMYFLRLQVWHQWPRSPHASACKNNLLVHVNTADLYRLYILVRQNGPLRNPLWMNASSHRTNPKLQSFLLRW